MAKKNSMFSDRSAHLGGQVTQRSDACHTQRSAEDRPLTAIEPVSTVFNTNNLGGETVNKKPNDFEYRGDR